MEVVIVGAGVFGASLAWWLSREGENVTLVDQFEPGDERTSSGGESRLLRCSHGSDGEYTALARRARALWRELEEEARAELLLECGVAWFAHRDDGWETASEQTLTALAIPVERSAATELYPSFRSDDLAFVLLEPEGGVLRAQATVRALVAGAAARGARLVRARARPDGAAVVLDDGTRLGGDVVVWACGAWLGRLFGELVSIEATRQELLFFDGGEMWRDPRVPAWVDFDRGIYGTADVDALGVKAALDRDGPQVDPDHPLPTHATTDCDVRAYLRDRFPALERAPLVRMRPCRYELTPDTHFVAAPHPEHPSVWLLGGGSGHGFKHGPALAERVARALRGQEPLPSRFGLGARTRGRGMRTASF